MGRAAAVTFDGREKRAQARPGGKRTDERASRPHLALLGVLADGVEVKVLDHLEVSGGDGRAGAGAGAVSASFTVARGHQAAT